MLLSAVVHTLQDKGIGMGASAWANAGLKLGLRDAMLGNKLKRIGIGLGMSAPSAAVAPPSKGPDAASIARSSLSKDQIKPARTLRQGEMQEIPAHERVSTAASAAASAALQPKLIVLDADNGE